jgi:flagellar assembly factor FliW
MTANYKAPIIINAGTLKGIQLIAENEDYLVKQPIYDVLKAKKGGE